MADSHDFDLRLRIGQERVNLSARIPDAPLSLLDLLPMLRSLTDLVTGVAEREAATAGQTVRCGPGCGACCRQLVPIAPVEAMALRRTIQELEPHHRRRVEAGFASAVAQLAGSDLLARIQPPSAAPRHTGSVQPGERRALGLDYFALAIPCPFLEHESCTIHSDRPLACREYLVTSDPRHCASPRMDTVVVVELPRRLSVLLFGLGAELAPEQPAWLPLTLAMDASRFDERAIAEARRSGPELFNRAIAWLAGSGTAGDASP